MTATPRPPPQPTATLRGHTSGIQALCFHGEELLLSGSQDGFLKVWNLERRRVEAEFRAHTHGYGVQRVECLDRDRMLSQGRDGLIKVWEMERLARGTGEPRTREDTIPHGDSRILSKEPSRTLTTGAFHFCQFALVRWRKASHASQKAAHGTMGAVEATSQGGCLEEGRVGHGEAECGGDWNKETLDGSGDVGCEAAPRKSQVQQGMSPFDGGKGDTSNDSFATNVLLAPCEEQHAVSMWDLRAAAPAYKFSPADPVKKGMVMCLRLLGESSSVSHPLAFSGHDNGSLCVYDLRATSAEPLIDVRLHTEPVLCVDVGSSGKHGISGSAGDAINVLKIDVAKGSCEVSKSFKLDHPGTSCLEIRRDERLFVTGGWDHRVRIFSCKNPRPLAVLRSHDESVYTIAHSPSVGIFASGSKDCRIALWDVFSDTSRPS